MSNKIHPHTKTTSKSKWWRKTQVSFLKKCCDFYNCSTTMLNIIKIWHFVQKKGIFSSVVYSQEYIFANGYERRIRPSFYRNPNFIFGT